MIMGRGCSPHQLVSLIIMTRLLCPHFSPPFQRRAAGSDRWPLDLCSELHLNLWAESGLYKWLNNKKKKERKQWHVSNKCWTAGQRRVLRDTGEGLQTSHHHLVSKCWGSFAQQHNSFQFSQGSRLTLFFFFCEKMLGVHYKMDLRGKYSHFLSF